MNRSRTLFALVLTSCIAALSCTKPVEETKAVATVGEINAQELFQKQQEHAQAVEQAKDAGKAAPVADFVVIDVRSPKEYEVSLIPGAITKQQFEQDREQYAGVTAIPYCTIGGRSGRYARELGEQGISVLNFKESIIGWCQQNLPLVDPNGAPTKQVHTYSSKHAVPEEYEAIW